MSETKTISALVDQIKEFLKRYKTTDGKYKYVDIIDGATSRTSILINTKDFINSNLEDALEFYNQLLKNPKDFIEASKKAVQEIYKEKHKKNKLIEVHFDEVENQISIVEALSNKFIQNIVTTTGVITSGTTVYNTATDRLFLCSDSHQIKSDDKPKKCNTKGCKSKNIREITPKENFQSHRTLYLKSDEDFSYHNDELKIDVHDDLTEVVQIGDRVKVTGIIEPQENKTNFNNFLDCVFIEKLDDVDLNVSKDDEEVFKQYPNESDFYTRMIHSIAPSILGLESIKESMLLMLVSSPDKQRRDGTKSRGWMHIGLFGDPSTAKTKLGEWLDENIPRCQLIMSKGATSTGLIMGLEDTSDGRKELRAGALINCRAGGVCILDEFPRLSSDVIDGLYTTVESGIASIAKTGHQAKIKADASLLVTGNAHNGKWNQALNVQDNLAIDGVFLQRFDFIWILIDDFSELKDRHLANAILNDVEYSDGVKPYSSITLAKYIKFVRNFKPELTDEVNDYLRKTWLELRANNEAKENGISPRHLNTLMRTTLAIARLYQKPYATIEDSHKAILLVREMFNQRNISISEADTYVTRNFNKAIDVLKNESINGLQVDDLFDKVLLFGTEKDQEQAKTDLGLSRSIKDNKKWREVIESLKRSPLIKTISRRPLILAYDMNKGDIRSFSK